MTHAARSKIKLINVVFVKDKRFAEQDQRRRLDFAMSPSRPALKVVAPDLRSPFASAVARLHGQVTKIDGLPENHALRHAVINA